LLFWLRKTEIYMWEFRSCVQFRCKWQCQGIIRGDSRLQIASISSHANLKLSCPEDLLTFVFEYGDGSVFSKSSNCFANNADIWQYVLWAASDLSVCKTHPFIPLSLSESGQILWSSFDKDSKGTNRENSDFDESIDEFVSMKSWKVLTYSACCVIETRKGWINCCFVGIVAFEHK